MKSANTIEINRILNNIFDNSKTLLELIAPDGWRNSDYIRFFHPTPEQQYEENTAMTKNLNKIARNQTPIEAYNPDNYPPDDLNNISEEKEFQKVLALSVYDIFSNNHEVYNKDGKVYDLGSFRGSGRFIAEYLNSRNPETNHYDYLDFYMGTIWIEKRADLLPFYEFIFQILKKEACDWNYCFPRIYLLDLSSDETKEIENPVDYKPEEAMANEIERLNRKKESEKFQNELDESFEKEYEEAKYRPLIPIVQAFKNIYNRLPTNHPQKEFE